ncbi:TRAP transporter small permease subunit [Shewanella sp. D64]|uniref:TRAP transporter small permease subunit n=1 Tax=unclassified Shewanella TaxID=196818 RepID=UPI0022BA3BAE|nr:MULTISPECIES: TRAP transporter small permease subunit [unclassified Shewanella]MEC4728544.1 TRAP transporter small permease subunit [Shewanella sp. D64]MEC4740548.1 TRAP transporter small permease subunit [Shewanella sp. E94]WBJ94257.1 TRAP transporter small permease subunit [Shewanella sp. MTB7]
MSQIEKITELIGKGVSWFTLLIVLMTLAVVVLRYAFDTGATAVQEGALYLHGAILTLAAGYTLKHDGHVRVDIFYRNFSCRGRHWVDLLGTLFLLFPVCIFIAYSCFDYVIASWRYSEISVEAGGLPFVYLQKSLLLLLVVSLLLQGTVDLVRHASALFGNKLVGDIEVRGEDQ